jgi:hypothetical protein
MSASAIEAEPETCALLMVVMMLNLPRAGSFSAAPLHSLAGRPTLAGSLAAAGCSPLPRVLPTKAKALRMSADAVGSGLPAHVGANVANFWVLAPGEGPPDPRHVKLCGDILQAQKAGEGQREALEALGGSPVAVELTSSLKDHRPFRLPGPGGTVAQVRETSFGSSGLGYALWDAGTGLAIWLALNRDAVAGKRVLELGSGVGIGGVAAGLVGAGSVVLTDFGQPEADADKNSVLRTLLSTTSELQGATASAAPAGSNSVVEEALQPRQLLSNLEYTLQLNRVDTSSSIIRLDWHQCLAPDYRPAETFDVIIGIFLVLLPPPPRASVCLCSRLRSTVPENGLSPSTTVRSLRPSPVSTFDTAYKN